MTITNHAFKNHVLTESERLWLSEVARSPGFSRRIAQVQLRDRLSRDFSPDAIDPRLYSGGKITLIGLWHVDPKHIIFEAMHKTILDVKRRIIADPTVTKITAAEIAQVVGLNEQLVAEALHAASEFGHFFTSATGPAAHGGKGYTSIELNDDTVYDDYLRYADVEELLDRAYSSRGRALQNAIAYSEQVSLIPRESRRSSVRAGPPGTSKAKRGTFQTAFETYTDAQTIGEGGAGQVFSAADSSGQRFAIKRLHPNLCTTERRKRFANEVEFLRTVRHHRIVSVLDTGLVDVDGVLTPFYVMPLFDGTLRQLMKGGLDHDRILPLYAHILDGAEAAHYSKVVHRDLKPENILYDQSTHSLLVADFGIAHFEEEQLLTAVETRHQDRLANFLYAAPEQRVRGQRVDLRADIYALGLMLNEMFTKEVPQGTGYRTIESVAPQFAYVDQIVERMIRQVPDARPSSIDEIKKELIGRGNEFLARQRLDEETRKVVPRHQPLVFRHVELTAFDWEANRLTLGLNQRPAEKWKALFLNPLEGHSALSGKGPGSFQFFDDKAFNSVDETQVQTLINHFKIYLDMANRAYEASLQQEALERERQERENHKQAIAAAEARSRVLKNVRL